MDMQIDPFFLLCLSRCVFCLLNFPHKRKLNYFIAIHTNYYISYFYCANSLRCQRSYDFYLSQRTRLHIRLCTLKVFYFISYQIQLFCTNLLKSKAKKLKSKAKQEAKCRRYGVVIAKC